MQGNQSEAVGHLLEAYETMLARVSHVAGQAGSAVSHGIFNAKEKAVELDELSKDEADKIARYLERDMHDAAEFLLETGQDFRDWFKFDVQLIEDRLFEMFAEVADQTRVELDVLAERARRASRLHTGEITGPGTLECVVCSAHLHFKKTGHIPPCASCNGVEFKRSDEAQVES